MPVASDTFEPPVRPQRRRADGKEGRLSRDRLTTVMVLSTLLTGLVILGVTFTAPGSADSEVNRGLEVVLVPDELPEAKRNDTATYLSQRTQLGSGNTRERLPAKLAAAPGQPVPPGTRDRQPGGDNSEQVLMSSRPAHTRIQMLPLPAALAHLTAQEEQDSQTPPALSGDQEQRLRGAARDEYYLSADTRASPFAPYVASWVQRVERIGTINYPNAARQGSLSGAPVIEVVVDRDGRLRSARILRGSGHPELDAAALDILHLASPFDPFPPQLARDYRTLRFAYEWQFEAGQPKGSLISVP